MPMFLLPTDEVELDGAALIKVLVRRNRAHQIINVNVEILVEKNRVPNKLFGVYVISPELDEL